MIRTKINLLFGVHNHQPVGNFASVFKKANQQCYRPFIDTLYNYPEIKTTVHISGSLIDWLLENDAGLLAKLKEMVGRHQVELLSGGYYEPILPIIPQKDALGQIKMLSGFIKDYFGSKPCGMWIGERVWEPDLVKTLVSAGVKYILLDDFHFRHAGIKEQNLFGYYLTEKDGQNLAVFPINKKLRYIVPFSQASQALAYLRSLASRKENRAAIVVDDGEKFGLWPGTHKWVYGKKWLERFFRLLIKNKDWLKTQTISEYMQKNKPLGLLHLPSASYEELMSWSGGNFRNFFSKYPEANNLHKRMLYVSEKINEAKEDNKEAKKYLYKGQCNCPYWHGVFGGIYLGHLRHAAYKNLITAQSLIEKKETSLEIEVLDFDKDGSDELILKNPFLHIFIAPKHGGGIFELDYLPKRTNLLDTMTRRPESYHQKIKKDSRKPFSWQKKKITSIHDLLPNKEKGLENFLIYDSYRRLSLLDHFFIQGLVFEDFKNSRYEELGDFINGQYTLTQRRQKQGISIILQRQGGINYQGGKIPLLLTKQLSLNNKDAQVSIEYKLENLSDTALAITFAAEFNVSAESEAPPNNLRSNAKSAQRVHSLKEDLQVEEVEQLSLQDTIAGIETTFYFDKKPNLWAHPLETISASEEGFERNYQHTVILPHWPITLEKSWEVKIIVAVSG